MVDLEEYLKRLLDLLDVDQFDCFLDALACLGQPALILAEGLGLLVSCRLNDLLTRVLG